MALILRDSDRNFESFIANEAEITPDAYRVLEYLHQSVMTGIFGFNYSSSVGKTKEPFQVKSVLDVVRAWEAKAGKSIFEFSVKVNELEENALVLEQYNQAIGVVQSLCSKNNFLFNDSLTQQLIGTIKSAALKKISEHQVGKGYIEEKASFYLEHEESKFSYFSNYIYSVGTVFGDYMKILETEHHENGSKSVSKINKLIFLKLIHEHPGAKVLESITANIVKDRLKGNKPKIELIRSHLESKGVNEEFYLSLRPQKG